MEKTLKEKLRKHMEEKIEILHQDVISYKELSKPVVQDDAIGRLTRMETINSRNINEAALRKTEYILSKLQNIILKIDDPDFGLCQNCEEPIPFARLMIMPESEVCVKCAEKISR